MASKSPLGDGVGTAAGTPCGAVNAPPATVPTPNRTQSPGSWFGALGGLWRGQRISGSGAAAPAAATPSGAGRASAPSAALPASAAELRVASPVAAAASTPSMYLMPADLSTGGPHQAEPARERFAGATPTRPWGWVLVGRAATAGALAPSSAAATFGLPAVEPPVQQLLALPALARPMQPQIPSVPQPSGAQLQAEQTVAAQRAANLAAGERLVMEMEADTESTATGGLLVGPPCMTAAAASLGHAVPVLPGRGSFQSAVAGARANMQKHMDGGRSGTGKLLLHATAAAHEQAPWTAAEGCHHHGTGSHQPQPVYASSGGSEGQLRATPPTSPHTVFSGHWSFAGELDLAHELLDTPADVVASAAAGSGCPLDARIGATLCPTPTAAPGSGVGVMADDGGERSGVDETEVVGAAGVNVAGQRPTSDQAAAMAPRTAGEAMPNECRPVLPCALQGAQENDSHIEVTGSARTRAGGSLKAAAPSDLLAAAAPAVSTAGEEREALLQGAEHCGAFMGAPLTSADKPAVESENEQAGATAAATGGTEELPDAEPEVQSGSQGTHMVGPDGAQAASSTEPLAGETVEQEGLETWGSCQEVAPNTPQSVCCPEPAASGRAASPPLRVPRLAAGGSGWGIGSGAAQRSASAAAGVAEGMAALGATGKNSITRAAVMPPNGADVAADAVAAGGGAAAAVTAPAPRPAALGVGPPRMCKRLREAMAAEIVHGWKDPEAVARRGRMLAILRAGGSREAALLAWGGGPGGRPVAPLSTLGPALEFMRAVRDHHRTAGGDRGGGKGGGAAAANSQVPKAVSGGS
jgi:hypothetical protein